MKRTGWHCWLVAPACLGMLLPAPWTNVALGAAPPVAAPNREAAARSESQPVPVIRDIALSAQGTLHGVVVDAQGAPLPQTSVFIRQAGQQQAGEVTTDSEGRFAMSGLRGGIYQVLADEGSGTFRLWADQTAPPTAQGAALVVARNGAVRGQMPLGDFFRTDAFIITAVVLAAIAIPVAVHNARDDASGS